MKMLIRMLALLTVLLLLPWTIKAQALVPVGSAECDFVYDRVERLRAVTLDTADYQLGPYSTALASNALGPFQWLGDLEQSELRFFGRFGEQVRSVKNAPTYGYESVQGAVVARPHELLFAYGSFRLDEALADDPAYTGKKWRGLAGDIDQAFVHLQAGSFQATLGRFASFWGPRRSLVLGPNVAMDGLGYSYRWGRIVLSYRLARLDGLDPATDSVAQFENRFFAGHRLDVHLSPRLRIGLFETAIFGGPGRQVELYYLNPILFYHASQLNDGVDDNTFLGFDFDYQPWHGVRLYGQLLVDDYQIDDEVQSDQEPNEIGLLTGAYVADILPKIDIRGEYTRVTNRTFNQSRPRNRYIYKGELIGAALGNDYDLAEIWVQRWLTPDNLVGLWVAHRRQGEGRVNAAWDRPWMEVEGDYSEPFPTGVVEKTTSAAVQFKGFLLAYLFIDAMVGVDRVTNWGNVAGDDRTTPFASVRLVAFGSWGVDTD